MEGKCQKTFNMAEKIPYHHVQLACLVDLVPFEFLNIQDLIT